MKFCPNCGQQFSDTAQRCSFCGYALKEQILYPGVQTQPAPQKAPKKNTASIVAIVALVVVIIASVTVTALNFWYSGQDSTEDQRRTSRRPATTEQSVPVEESTAREEITTQDTTAPTTVQSEEPVYIVWNMEDELNPPSAWTMRANIPGVGYLNAHYAFMEDGTCYLVMGVDVWLIGVATGTYTLKDNSLSITMDYQGTGAYCVTYEYDTAYSALRQTSKRGMLDQADDSTSYSFNPSDMTVEEIIKKATTDWSSMDEEY